MAVDRISLVAQRVCSMVSELFFFIIAILFSVMSEPTVFLKVLILNHKSPPGHVLGMFLAACLLISVLIMLLYMLGYDPIAAVRDQDLNDVPEAGLISNLGIGLMVIATLTTTYEALRGKTLRIGLLALFCGLFMLDDALEIHEAFRYEIGFYAFYACVFAGVITLFRRDFGQWSLALLAVLAAFGLSVMADLIWTAGVIALFSEARSFHFLMRLGFLAEDIPKFAGIALLTSFALGETVSRSISKATGPTARFSSRRG